MGPATEERMEAQEKHLAWLSDIHIRDITFLGSVKFPIFFGSPVFVLFFLLK